MQKKKSNFLFNIFSFKTGDFDLDREWVERSRENFVFSFKRLKFKRASFCCLFAFFGSKSSIFSFSLSSLSAPKLVINITLFWDESVLEYLGDVDEDSLDLLEHERELFGLVLATIKL